MIERVAAALSFNLPNDVTLTGTQEKRIAHAVIATMREPTEAMLEAGRAVAPVCDDPITPPADYWVAMIDAALTATTTAYKTA